MREGCAADRRRRRSIRPARDLRLLVRHGASDRHGCARIRRVYWLRLSPHAAPRRSSRRHRCRETRRGDGRAELYAYALHSFYLVAPETQKRPRTARFEVGEGNVKLHRTGTPQQSQAMQPCQPAPRREPGRYLPTCGSHGGRRVQASKGEQCEAGHLPRRSLPAYRDVLKHAQKNACALVAKRRRRLRRRRHAQCQSPFCLLLPLTQQAP